MTSIGCVFLIVISMLFGAFWIRNAVVEFKNGNYFLFGFAIMIDVFAIIAMMYWTYVALIA